jgi:phospholipid/cholesterol/gamma-HCH transport system substrate-binding protein
MYASRTTQFLVGIFALIGIAALVVLSVSLGKVQIFAPAGYTLYANFDNISGLKVGDSVDLDGVHIGKVTGIRLKDLRAHVSLFIDQGVEIDKDAIAGIKTEGLLGNRYVSVALGPSDKILTDHDTIVQTESAFVLEDAIGTLINNLGSGGGSKDCKDGSEKQASSGGSSSGDDISLPPGVSDSKPGSTSKPGGASKPNNKK